MAVHAQGRTTLYDVVQRWTTTYVVVRRRTWSDNVVRPRTLSLDAVRRQWVNDLYDVVMASSSYLYTFGKFSGRRNRRTRDRRFWVHDVLRSRDDLGEYARLV